MNRDSRNARNCAPTLRDLGELNARWIEDDPYPEAIPLVPVLGVLNRAGFVTTVYQAGQQLDEEGREQRAAIEFFAEWLRVTVVMRAAENAGLTVIAHKPEGRPRWRDRRGNLVPVTRCQCEVTCALGDRASRRSIAYSYAGFSDCHPDAVKQLLGAWQVTVIDPKWGPSDRLWRTLAGVVLSPGGAW